MNDDVLGLGRVPLNVRETAAVREDLRRLAMEDWL